MNKPTKRLGRGLDSLVSDLLRKDQPHQSLTELSGPEQQAVARIPLDRITPNPFQPRSDVPNAHIQHLADSIRENGVLQPVTVRKVGDQYQIVAGERRYRAVRLLGHTDIPAIVRQASDQQMLELALVENIQREDLNAIDRAQAYQQFCDTFELTPSDVAIRLGEDRTTVTNYLRLLELDERIQTLVAQRVLSMGHARALLGVDDEESRWAIAQRTVTEGLSVRAVEALVRSTREEGRSEGGSSARGNKGLKRTSTHLQNVERQMENVLKTKVTILEGARRGTGRITIEYQSFDDFDRILECLGVSLDQ